MHPPLTPNAIYAALYWRTDGKYHWALIVTDSSVSGKKLHATNLEDPTTWRYASDDFDVSAEWKPLVILAQIGVASEGTSSVDDILRMIPMATPACDSPHPFTCRIWFREAVRVLIAQGMVTCRSVDALEKELTLLADDNGNSVALGRPWKLHSDVDSVS
ncbi:hypothetical protein L226DRAFT_534753 [Lentinus tigrinus ALCF2SS1-7]|uniref:Uncharacterized protein n=1 Tax=Lentinus tigrinus ALCF2SS1-6 TaxID=1328759 RepID=A0A5C2SB89_9APHY|nr:hypothetical protein L227DRAFT_574729 [Lentinus tigrinus ALCF2SS1-6]RPD75175.1 hypothetical protein L226DRAFT_534753 [Lentinus tigrinus ALCF2SS1-7]